MISTLTSTPFTTKRPLLQIDLIIGLVTLVLSILTMALGLLWKIFGELQELTERDRKIESALLERIRAVEVAVDERQDSDARHFYGELVSLRNLYDQEIKRIDQRLTSYIFSTKKNFDRLYRLSERNFKDLSQVKQFLVREGRFQPRFDDTIPPLDEDEDDSTTIQ